MKSIASALLSLLLAAPAHAALFCDGDTTNTVTWTVGQPTDAIHAIGFDTGIECFVTGPEVAYVQTHLTGLHAHPKAGWVLWTGDDAQFIVDNL